MAPPKPNTSPPKKAVIIHNIAKSGSPPHFILLQNETHRFKLVIMTIPPGGEIGEETHTVDQHLYFVSGTARCITDGSHKDEINPGDHVIIPSGTLHNFINTGPTPLIVSTVYAPAEHKADTVHDSLEQGEKLEEEGKDEPPQWAKE
ncbi:uncharacterized protein FIBRA_01665 [Fibroporia radiculosa]|uniref:Cupin type-2 domain-containing protein n=1 Tax=Fibroporia radiculosa TaxID=599839 RepID=J4GKY5_9APHY|nr:uncharacterized protein FIBRA_01665 [Fibroporia radiculosa]CCL99645.1 predicted protein [Fibroporia radiculosa]